MIICKECGREFQSLGFARHRTAHRERRDGLIKRPMPKPKKRKLKLGDPTTL